MAARKRRKQSPKKKKPAKAKAGNRAPQEKSLTLYEQQILTKKQVEKLGKQVDKLQERLEDAEIHINLLTRLITTLCVEKLGMRVGVLKRLLKRIEKEAIRDSQILHLESLYNLPHTPGRKPPAYPQPPRDPWEDIS